MDKPSELNEIPVQLDEMQNLLKDLETGIDTLCERLVPVLHASGVEARDEEKPVKTLVPLANVLRSHNDCVRASIGRIGNLCNRIQV